MKNRLVLCREFRFPLLDRLEETTSRGGLVHLSSELEFYGIDRPEEIRAGVEGCIRILRHTAGDPQRHFLRTFADTPSGLRQVWLVSEAGWEMLLERMAPNSPQLSQRLLRRLKIFRRG